MAPRPLSNEPEAAERPASSTAADLNDGSPRQTGPLSCGEYSSWDIKEIEERQSELADDALEAWPIK